MTPTNQIIRVIISPPATAQENMNKDQALFEGLKKGEIPPALRLYTWSEKAITAGYSIYSTYQKHNCQMSRSDPIRRPTGGGIVYHDAKDEITIALTHYLKRQEGVSELYKKIHTPFLSILQSLGYAASLFLTTHNSQLTTHNCFASPCAYDIMLKGSKIMGGALRLGRGCFLYQGTLKLPNFSFKNFLKALLSNATFKNDWGNPIIKEASENSVA